MRRERSRDDYHQRDNRRDEEREGRSRDYRGYREREQREQRGRQQWQRNERKAPFNAGNVQEKERNTVESIVKIDRKQICPFLVKVFYSINKENIFEANGKQPQNHIYLHLWMDCSLREIGELLRAHIPLIRSKQRFQFWRVYSQEGKNALCKQELGSVLMHRRTDRADDRILSNLKFKLGDYLDVSIYYK